MHLLDSTMFNLVSGRNFTPEEKIVVLVALNNFNATIDQKKKDLLRKYGTNLEEAINTINGIQAEKLIREAELKASPSA